MAFDINQILAEIHSADLTGMSVDQINALITAQVQPVIDRQAADEAAISQISANIASATSGVMAVNTALQALTDKLANVQPAPAPAAPPA